MMALAVEAFSNQMSISGGNDPFMHSSCTVGGKNDEYGLGVKLESALE